MRVELPFKKEKKIDSDFLTKETLDEIDFDKILKVSPPKKQPLPKKKISKKNVYLAGVIPIKDIPKST